MKRLLIVVAGIIVWAAMFVSPAWAQIDSPDSDVKDPDACARCHEGYYEAWSDSAHANALANPAFIEAFNRADSPEYCYRCHASGYNPYNGDFRTEGVDCLSCHEFSSSEDGPHMLTTASTETCAECHTGNHAPNYDQWLTSDHATMNIGCLDCHSSHSMDLHQGTTEALCTSCHNIDMADSVHDNEGMACEACHMAQGDTVIDALSGQTNGSGHDFSIPAQVCGDCHGMAHTITPTGESHDTTITTISNELMACEAGTEATAANKLNLGLTGGGIAGLMIGVGITFLLVRRRDK